MGRSTFGYRKTAKAQRDLAELSAEDKSPEIIKTETRGGGFVVTFSHGLGDKYTDIRVFVWAASRAAALFRALSLSEVEDWIKRHPQANSSVMSAGQAPVTTREGKIFSARAS